MFENKEDLKIYVEGAFVNSVEEMFKRAEEMRLKKCDEGHINVYISVGIKKGDKILTGQMVLVG